MSGAKSLREDIRYACGRVIKDGLSICSYDGNLTINNELRFVPATNSLCAFEALIVVRNYLPADEMLLYFDTFNMSLVNLVARNTDIDKTALYLFLDGFTGISDVDNDFVSAGKYIRDKFLTQR